MPTLTIPGTAKTAVAWDRTGLVGTIGVRVLDNIGGTPLGRVTAGIIEYPPGSGVYQATIPDFGAAGFYSIAWDDLIRFDVVPLTVTGVSSGFTGGFFDQSAAAAANYTAPAPTVRAYDEPEPVAA